MTTADAIATLQPYLPQEDVLLWAAPAKPITWRSYTTRQLFLIAFLFLVGILLLSLGIWGTLTLWQTKGGSKLWLGLGYLGCTLVNGLGILWMLFLSRRLRVKSWYGASATHFYYLHRSQLQTWSWEMATPFSATPQADGWLEVRLPTGRMFDGQPLSWLFHMQGDVSTAQLLLQLQQQAHSST